MCESSSDNGPVGLGTGGFKDRAQLSVLIPFLHVFCPSTLAMLACGVGAVGEGG